MVSQLGNILMRVIRTLSESDSGVQREEQKRQLQAQFRETDAALDGLVLKKQKELTKVLQIYARVSNRLANARSRVAEIKTGLVACKELLHYKRDDLKVSLIERPFYVRSEQGCVKFTFLVTKLLLMRRDFTTGSFFCMDRYLNIQSATEALLSQVFLPPAQWSNFQEKQLTSTFKTKSPQHVYPFPFTEALARRR